jgi:acetyl esterase
MRSDERDGDRAGEVVLDPAIADLIDAMATPPSLRQLGPQDGRVALVEAQGSRCGRKDTVAEFYTAPVGPSGLTGFWVIRPLGAEGPLPMVFYLHGGRWMFGDADTHAHLIAEIAIKSATAMVVPEYTRTPEARYPVAVEECYATLVWAYDNHEALGIDPRAIAVAGDCAGATIAIVMSMLAKSRGGPRLRAQLLFYPPTDSRCDSPSHHTFREGFLLTSEEQAWYWDQYGDSRSEQPTVSPLYASQDDLTGLPPTMLITAEADVVRDEGAAFAAKLRAAGVSVTACRYLGTIHDFVALSQLAHIAPTRAAVDQGAWFLHDALQRWRRPRDMALRGAQP